jgi:monomeric isocitrate dehydrogenase
MLVLFLEQDSVVVQTSGITTTARVLSVFADSTTAELGVASQLSRLSKSGSLFKPKPFWASLVQGLGKRMSESLNV